MSLIARQYADPFIYNAVAIDGNAGTPKTLRELILALSGGQVPPADATIVAVRIVPAATVRLIGGFRPKNGGTAAGWRAAAEGGGYELITTSGGLYDFSDCLDYFRLLADGAGSTTATISLYTSGQSAS